MKAAQPGDKGDIAACRRVLTFNNLRNVVTIDLHFITLLIFVADKAGIVIYGGLTVGQNHATIFGCHDVIAAATGNRERQSYGGNQYCPFFHRYHPYYSRTSYQYINSLICET